MMELVICSAEIVKDTKLSRIRPSWLYTLKGTGRDELVARCHSFFIFNVLPQLGFDSSKFEVSGLHWH